MIKGEYYVYTNDAVVEVESVLDDGAVGIYFLPERKSISYVHPDHLRLPGTLVDGNGETWDLQPSNAYHTRDAARVDTLTLAAIHHHFGIAEYRDKEEPVKENPFNVGDVVRFRPLEYEVTRADHPDEVEMKPVVEGEGDDWLVQPEELELVRRAPSNDPGFWRHKRKGYNLVVTERHGSLRVYYTPEDNGAVTRSVGMTREYLHDHFYKL
jgi:hypothetical protein